MTRKQDQKSSITKLTSGSMCGDDMEAETQIQEEALEEIPEGIPGSGAFRTPGKKPWAIRAQQMKLGRWGGAPRVG